MFKRLAVTLFAFCGFPVLAASAQEFVKQFGDVDSSGVKVCSAVIPGNWRNDLIVPQSWKSDDCKAWAVGQILATDYNLACLHDHAVQYDFSPGWNNSCGW